MEGQLTIFDYMVPVKFATRIRCKKTLILPNVFGKPEPLFIEGKEYITEATVTPEGDPGLLAKYDDGPGMRFVWIEGSNLEEKFHRHFEVVEWDEEAIGKS